MTTKIGITGGIGSGKSVVSRLLQVMGVPVYLSDVEAKRLTATDAHIRSRLVELLGADVYRDGSLNKPLLANYLFSDPEHARIINGIIHPRVKEDFRRWVLQHQSHDVVAMESAILVEAGFADEVDKLVMVYAPLQLRVERAMQRDGADRASILRRVSQQMNDEEKKLHAHHILFNDGSRPLIPQVVQLLHALR